MTRNVRTCPGNGLIDYAHAPSHHLMLDKIQREKFMPVGITFEEPSWAYGWTLFPVEKPSIGNIPQSIVSKHPSWHAAHVLFVQFPKAKLC